MRNGSSSSFFSRFALISVSDMTDELLLHLRTAVYFVVQTGSVDKKTVPIPIQTQERLEHSPRMGVFFMHALVIHVKDEILKGCLLRLDKG